MDDEVVSISHNSKGLKLVIQKIDESSKHQWQDMCDNKKLRINFVLKIERKATESDGNYGIALNDFLNVMNFIFYVII